MLESGPSGSVRGVSSNGHPYRDPRPIADLLRDLRSAVRSSRTTSRQSRRAHTTVIQCRGFVGTLPRNG
jgi:hypothetical protein